MTLSQLVDAVEKAAPTVGYLIQPTVKKARASDRAEVFFQAWFYLPDQTLTLHSEPDAESVLKKFLAAIGKAASPSLAKIDAHRLRPGERKRA